MCHPIVTDLGRQLRGLVQPVDASQIRSLTCQRNWRGLATTTALRNQLDFTYMGAALGNTFSYANAGVILRYGKRLPSDYESPRIQQIARVPAGNADFVEAG